MSHLEANNSPDNSLRCHYSQQSLTELLASDRVLAVIGHGADCQPAADARHYPSGLVPLSDADSYEVWSTSSPVCSGTDQKTRWSRSEELLFAARWVDDGSAADQAEAIYNAYSDLLGFIEHSGYPHIARIWNYMPDINEGKADSERYRRFCLGRKRAFEQSSYRRNSYPSACALGHDGKQTLIYMLARKEPTRHIENPRQQSAYEYPREYGPASPLFARASLVDWLRGSQLFVSGTASIVGHESRFPDNLDGQLQTTFDNIDILLQRAASEIGAVEIPKMSILKVYIRRPEDYEAVRAAIGQRFGGVAAHYVRADICREELLVEIDGVADLSDIPQASSLPNTKALIGE
ncbi:MAG: hypothetical protein AAGI44_12980 [Pseudomonadota bacterium]